MARRWTALFFAALLALGWLTCADYGQPWDEPWEMDILRMNLNEYLAAAGLDARLALSSSVEKPESGRIRDSVERDHGESAYYPAAWLVSASGLSDRARMTLWHGYTWAIFTLGAFALYAIARRLGLNRALACVAALTLVLSPRFFAEGHYNNKDLALLAAVLCSLWTALRLGERTTVGRALTFALCGAVAANTKVAGAALWGVCGLLALGFYLQRGPGGRERLAPALAAALLGFAAFYALLTPALWGDPIGFVRYLVQNATDFSRWNHYVLFRGAVFWLKTQPLPRYYLPWMIVVTTPLWALALIALGQLATLWRLVRSPRRTLADPAGLTALAATLLWLAPLAFAVATGTRVYNGWRHFYFLYGPLLVLGAVGLRELWSAMRSARRAPRIAARCAGGLLAAAMLITGAGEALNHPSQCVYYNALARADAQAGRYELDYWNVSALGTLERLCQAVPEGALSVAGADLWSQTGLESAAPLLDDASRARVTVLPLERAGEADYTFSNATYAAFSGWTSSSAPVARTSAYGCVLSSIILN